MGSLRFLTAGESHGPALNAIIEGIPAGLTLIAEDLNHDLKRRQGGHGRGGRMKIEHDRVTILSGVRGGETLGSPISLLIQNQDWDNWSGVMGAEPDARTDERRLTRPRPGHADLSGSLKYHHQDLRNVLERASARETAARVAVGSVARSLLQILGVEVIGWVERIGNVRTDTIGYDIDQIGEIGLEEWRHRIEASPVYCPDEKVSLEMVDAITAAGNDGDTLGGVMVVNAWGVPPGLGSYVHWDRRLDGRLAAAVMSIPGIKGVEIGLGFQAASEKGSSAHDEIFYSSSAGLYRQTNRAGGLEGGMTNGQPLVVRVAMKPIPTLMQPLRSVDLETGEAVAAGVERSDVCAVPAASVIAEAAVGYIVAQAVLEKFSGDTMNDLMRGWQEHWEYVEKKRGI